MDQGDRKRGPEDRKGRVGALDEHRLQRQLDRIKRDERSLEREAADDAGLLQARSDSRRKGVKPLEIGTSESRDKLESFDREHNPEGYRRRRGEQLDRTADNKAAKTSEKDSQRPDDSRPGRGASRSER